MVYTYDAGNNMVSQLYQNWDSSGWVNFMQYNYTYDAGNNQTGYLWQDWNGTTWNNYQQSTSIYDASNNQTNGLIERWNGNAWMILWQEGWTYDVNNFLISEALKSPTCLYTFGFCGDSTYYYFHTAVGINDWTKPQESITVYPNPVVNELNIQNKSTQRFQFELYNSLGEKIYDKWLAGSSCIIDVSPYLKGIYFYKVTEHSNQVTRGKIIKQ
jgi:hypothetical protein